MFSALHGPRVPNTNGERSLRPTNSLYGSPGLRALCLSALPATLRSAFTGRAPRRGPEGLYGPGTSDGAPVPPRKCRSGFAECAPMAPRLALAAVDGARLDSPDLRSAAEDARTGAAGGAFGAGRFFAGCVAPVFGFRRLVFVADGSCRGASSSSQRGALAKVSAVSDDAESALSKCQFVSTPSAAPAARCARCAPPRAREG